MLNQISSKLYRMICCWLCLLVLVAPPVYSQNSGADIGVDGDGTGLSLLVGTDGSPILSHFNRLTSQIKLTEFVNNSWTSQVAVSGVTSSENTALLLSGPEVHIFFSDGGTHRLRHAVRINGTWTVENIDTATASDGAVSAIRCGPQFCVSYYDTAQGNLKLVRGSTGAWQSVTVDGAATDVGFYNRLAAGSMGLITVSYYDRTNQTLKFAFEQGNGSFQLQSLPSVIAYVAPEFDGVYDTAGVFHVVFSLSRPSPAPIEVGVGYAKRATSGSWDVAIVDRSFNGGPVTAALTSQGVEIAARHVRAQSITGSAIELRRFGLSGPGSWSVSNYGYPGSLGTTSYQYSVLRSAFSAQGTYYLAYQYLRVANGSTPPKSAIYIHGASGGTQPTPDPRLADSDGDGLSDGDEASRGTDPNVADSDGDGFSDGAEVDAGTDPLERASHLSALGQSFCSEWGGLPGSNIYQLQLANISGAQRDAKVSILDNRGKLLFTKDCSIAAGGQCQVNITDLALKKRVSSGVVCVEHTGAVGDITSKVTLSRGTIDAKRKVLRAAEGLTVLTGQNGERGNQLVFFDSTDRRRAKRDVSFKFYNRLVLVNPNATAISGALIIRSHKGSVVKQISANLNPFSRADWVIGKGVGSVEWSPSTPTERAVLRHLRYGTSLVKKSPTLKFVASVAGILPSGLEQRFPIDVRKATALLDLTNASASPITVSVQGIIEGGGESAVVQVPLAPHTGTQLLGTALLGGKRRGMLVVKGSNRASTAALLTQLSYSSNGEISRVYAVQNSVAAGAVVMWPFSVKSGQRYRAVLVNRSAEKQAVQIHSEFGEQRKIDSRGSTVVVQTIERALPLAVELSPGAMKELDLSSIQLGQSSGSFIIQSENPGVISAWGGVMRGHDPLVVEDLGAQ